MGGRCEVPCHGPGDSTGWRALTGQEGFKRIRFHHSSSRKTLIQLANPFDSHRAHLKKKKKNTGRRWSRLRVRSSQHTHHASPISSPHSHTTRPTKQPAWCNDERCGWWRCRRRRGRGRRRRRRAGDRAAESPGAKGRCPRAQAGADRGGSRAGERDPSRTCLNVWLRG